MLNVVRLAVGLLLCSGTALTCGPPPRPERLTPQPPRPTPQPPRPTPQPPRPTPPTPPTKEQLPSPEAERIVGTSPTCIDKMFPLDDTWVEGPITSLKNQKVAKKVAAALSLETLTKPYYYKLQSLVRIQIQRVCGGWDYHMRLIVAETNCLKGTVDKNLSDYCKATCLSSYACTVIVYHPQYGEDMIFIGKHCEPSTAPCTPD